MDRNLNFGALAEELEVFAERRDWTQFHNPKNLAMALAAESGELLEIFQWLSTEESPRVSDDPERRQRVAEELADVLIYAIRLADIVGVDLSLAIDQKVKSNEARYPVEEVKGRAVKRD